MPPRVGARFCSTSHPRGTVFATIPEGVNLAFVDSLLFTPPAMKDRDFASHVMALFFITGFVAVGGVDSRFNAYARAHDILSLGDISIGGGQSFGVLGPLTRRIFDSTYDRTFSNLGGMEYDETDQVVDLTSGDVSYVTGRLIEDSPVLLPSVSTLAELPFSSSLSGSWDCTMGSSTHVQQLSPSEQNLLAAMTPPAENICDDTSSDKLDSMIVSLHRTQHARLAPIAYCPSQSTIFSMINILKYQNPLSLNWNAIVTGLAVIVGFDKTNFGGFKQSPVAVESGQEKNESSNVCDLPRLLLSVVEEKTSLVAHVGERPPASIGECSYPFSVTGDFNHSSSSLINLIIQSPDNGFGIGSSYGAFFFGCGKSYNKLPMSFFLGILVAMVLVYLGLTLMKSIVDLFQTKWLPIFESSIEVSVCQELANAVPESLLCDDLVPVNAERPTRLASPLGCVILTPSGPRSIDPRSNRQIAEEEDTSKYGLPVEALAYPRTPPAALASCFAGSRPESPYKAPRKVTFADENDVFILPHVNLTKDRNLRRRLSRRLTAKFASDDGKNTNVLVAKSR